MAEEREKMEKPLEFANLLFKWIDACGTAKTLEEYIVAVENLGDFLYSWWRRDKRFLKAMEINGNQVPDLSNQIFEGMSLEKQRDYARKLFRELMDVVYRSGFLPYREVDVIIE